MHADTCIIKGCRNCRGKRGLCPAHYSAARRMVERGAIDWVGLEGRGLALPGKRGRPSKFAVLLDVTADKLTAARRKKSRGRRTATQQPPPSKPGKRQTSVHRSPTTTQAKP